MPDEVTTTETNTTPQVDTTTTAQVAATVEPKNEQTKQTEVTATPETTNTATTETTATKDTQKDTGLSKGIKTEIYKLRAERRELREKVEMLEKLVKNGKATPTPTEEPVPTFFDDPEKRLEVEKARIKADVLAEIQHQEQLKLERARIEQEGQQTIEMLLNKPEVGGDISKIEEIDEIIRNDARLSEIVKVSPQIAGNVAYEMWAKDKGIDPQAKKAAAVAKVATSAPASTPMTPKSARTMADIQADAARLDPSDPKFTEKWQSLLNESLTLK